MGGCQQPHCCVPGVVTTCRSSLAWLSTMQEVRGRWAAQAEQMTREKTLEQERLLAEAAANLADEMAHASASFDADAPLPPSMRRSESFSSHASDAGLASDASDVDSDQNGVWWQPRQFPGLRPYHWLLTCPYHCLGLQSGASMANVKARYRQLALALHPDKGNTHPHATAAFVAVTKAYRSIQTTRGGLDQATSARTTASSS